MRRKGERRRALQLCAVLALVAFALLVRRARLGPGTGPIFAPSDGSCFDLVWRMIYDAGTGLAVVIRVLGRAVAFGPYGLGLVVLLAFIFSISLLSFLIARLPSHANH